MKFLLDSNILIYSFMPLSPNDYKTGDWLDEAVNDASNEIIVTEAVVLSFYRIATNPKAFAVPMTAAQAGGTVSGFLANKNVILFQPSRKHFQSFDNFIAANSIQTKNIPDAYLCAVALATGATLVTCDKGFKKYPQVKIINPK